jgi:hypothetical protein
MAQRDRRPEQPSALADQNPRRKAASPRCGRFPRALAWAEALDPHYAKLLRAFSVGACSSAAFWSSAREHSIYSGMYSPARGANVRDAAAVDTSGSAARSPPRRGARTGSDSSIPTDRMEAP